MHAAWISSLQLSLATLGTGGAPNQVRTFRLPAENLRLVDLVENSQVVIAVLELSGTGTVILIHGVSGDAFYRVVAPGFLFRFDGRLPRQGLSHRRTVPLPRWWPGRRCRRRLRGSREEPGAGAALYAQRFSLVAALGLNAFG